MEHKQQLQKQRYDQHTTARQFIPDETVFVRNFGEGDSWLPVNAPGSRSYNVKLSDNRIVRRHADHILSRSVDLPEQNPNNDLDDTIPIVVPGTNPFADNMVPSVPLRRSTRVSRPPDRLLHNI